MTRDTADRLRDISEALDSTEQHIGGSFADPEVGSPLILHAVLFNLLIIGEAAKGIDKQLRSGASDVPWADYAGLRDVIAHQYFRIQRQIIEDTIRKDLPELRVAVRELLADQR